MVDPQVDARGARRGARGTTPDPRVGRTRVPPTGAGPRRAVSLDEPQLHGHADPKAPNPEASLLDDETVRRVRAAIAALAPLERAVLAHRFGLEDRPLLSLRETGAALGLCGERVRQIERRSLDRVRRALARTELRRSSPAHHLRPIESPIRSGVVRSNFTASASCGLR